MKRKLLIIGVIVLLVGLVLGGGVVAMRSATSGNAAATATPVRIEPVARGDLSETVQAPGEIQPRTKVSISARVSARIAALPFAEGGRVKAGDVVVRLDSTDLEAALRSAEARYAGQRAQITVSEARVRGLRAQISANKATLREAIHDLKRQQGLLESKDVAQSVVDTAQQKVDEQQALLDAAEQNIQAEEATLLVLKHTLDAAEADVVAAKTNLSYTTITAPIGGLIIRLNAKVGELVMTGTMNNAGTVILEIGDFSEMVMAARMDESNIAAIHPGQSATIHAQAYGTRSFPGVVETVALAQLRSDPQMGEDAQQGRYFKVNIRVDSAGERLFSGLTADAEIQTKHHASVLKVPSQCVLGRNTDDLPQAIREGNPNVDRTTTQTTVVYRFVDGKAIVTPVRVGPSDLTHTLIKSGLAEGDKVITGPYKVLESLAHEQAVKDEKPATQPSTQPSTQPTTGPSTKPSSQPATSPVAP